jgi:murein DD-endopeptidase MepM/ murein hydrolase activator NlpD
MPSRRYTIFVTDRTSGVVRRFTVSTRPVIAVACAIVSLPVLIGAGAAWKAYSDSSALYASHQALQDENDNYRAATEQLAGQIQTLEGVLSDIRASSALDPKLAHAMDKLPAVVKARAMGGVSKEQASRKDANDYAKTITALSVPEDTFGLLRNVLEGLESRLAVVRDNVERRNALAKATPSIWPAKGWLSSLMGARQDPITGDDGYHPGVDIAADKGQPVFATAEGTVKEAAWDGGYGNLVVLDHGFGLETRYGHLSAFTVHKGDHVTRGQLIGRVGSTGHATGPHLHYEVLANGKLLNPLQLLTQQKPRAQ